MEDNTCEHPFAKIRGLYSEKRSDKLSSSIRVPRAELFTMSCLHMFRLNCLISAYRTSVQGGSDSRWSATGVRKAIEKKTLSFRPRRRLPNSAYGNVQTDHAQDNNPIQGTHGPYHSVCVPVAEAHLARVL